MVSKVSASPLHLDAKVYGVDENHTSICKVNRDSTVFKHIKTFLLELAKERTASAMVLYVHGYDKQTYELQPDVELDWTGYFDVLASPRILPGPDMWQQSIATDLEFATKTWSQEWARKGGRIKIYSKLCLPGGVLIGNRFSRTKGAVIEVNHYKQLWSSEKADSSFKVVGKKTPGNNLGSSKAVVVLSVTNDIGDAVKNYLDTTSIDYRMAINVLPPNGVGHNSIQNAEQAVAYAMGVKSKIEELKNEGIEEINLFLNCPFSIAVFVGHYLTAVSPMKVFDFANPGYVESCHL
ncbi:SAVED domain-containing protein [Bacillus cereus]